MPYGHPSRERETFYHTTIFEYDKKFRIRKAHIQKKGEYEVSSHDIGDRLEVGLSEKTQEEDVKCQDSERSKYGYHIMCFEEREKMPESIENSLKRAVEFGTIRLSV